jgi:hypothetical protein
MPAEPFGCFMPVEKKLRRQRNKEPCDGAAGSLEKSE